MFRSSYPAYRSTDQSPKRRARRQSAQSGPDFEAAKAYALWRLERDLAPDLSYHSIGHTRDDVVPAIERLAAIVGVGPEERLLLRTAAYFHDLGFVEQRAGHEEVSARIAAEILPRFGYRLDQIDAIRGLILATRIPHNPQNMLEAMMADADLDGLGREDFWLRSQDLRDELAAYGVIYSDQEWYANQLTFLQSHHYLTPAARALRAAQKGRHTSKLAALLEK